MSEMQPDMIADWPALALMALITWKALSIVELFVESKQPPGDL